MHVIFHLPMTLCDALPSNNGILFTAFVLFICMPHSLTGSAGVIDKLEQAGIEEGDTVELYGLEFEFYF